MARPVAVLDADGGGLGFLAELTRRLPGEEYVYLADSARGPYGRATVAEVHRWTEQGAYFLLRFDPKVLALASHTMGAVAGEHLHKRFPVPVFSPCGLLARRLAEPGARWPFDKAHGPEQGGGLTGAGVVALVASEASLASGFYQEALAKVGPGAVLCPAGELAEAVVDGAVAEAPPSLVIRQLTDEALRAPAEKAPQGPAGRGGVAALVEQTLAPVLGFARAGQVEAVFLAESGLERVAPLVQQLLGPGVLVVSVLAQLAGEVERMLTLLQPPGGLRGRYFFASGDVERFRERGALLYGEPLGRVVAASPGRFFEQIGPSRTSPPGARAS